MSTCVVTWRLPPPPCARRASLRAWQQATSSLSSRRGDASRARPTAFSTRLVAHASSVATAVVPDAVRSRWSVRAWRSGKRSDGGTHVMRSSAFASSDSGDAQRRRSLLELALEECDDEECTEDLAAAGRAGDEEDEEEEEDEIKDKRLQKDGVHTSIFNWLVHRMPGQAREKLPSIVADETDNQSCWALAFCGFLWTSSTCMVFSLLPVFLKTELGYSNTRIGAMEGSAVLMANLSRVISGVMSDVIKSRVKVIALGSAMTAAMKLLLASAISPEWVMSAKLLDRFGKGVRAAPTDALIADLSPRQKRSTTYGLHQSLTTLGGVFGSMCAVACMTLTHNNYRATFTLAAVPSVFAIFMLLYFVRKPNRLQTKHYGMPKFPARPARPAPNKRRHGRGPLAMVYEPVRWRRAQCKDKGRDMAWHRGKRTWRRVNEWLSEHLEDMKRRAQRVKEKRPGEQLFPQLSRRDGEVEEELQTRQREWEAEYLSTEAEQKYRRLRGLRRRLGLVNFGPGSPTWDAGVQREVGDGGMGLAAGSTALDTKISKDVSRTSVADALATRAEGLTSSSTPNVTSGGIRILGTGAAVATAEVEAAGHGHVPESTLSVPKVEKEVADSGSGVPKEEKKVAWGAWRWSLSEAVQLPWAFWRALLVFTVLKVSR
mmetsp:Transcript_42016/g.67511  ORF Transcript_42016/g.67511 Transcript_42016/m.67511 type:complete len:658 (+) Transcript_42016:97-2070(+)